LRYNISMFSDPASNLAKLCLTEGMKVADIGAGAGFYTILAAKQIGPSGRIYAIDVQKDLLERIRSIGSSQGLRNIEIVWGNAEKIGGTKVREMFLDGVIVSNILFQIEKPEEFVLEIKRITKHGAKVLLVDWNELTTIGPKNIVTPDKAQLLFEKYGFKVDQSFNAGDHHYGMVFTRT